MKIISHEAIGASAAVLMNFDLVGIGAVTVGAILPDMADVVLAGRNRELWEKIHRTVSHWWVLWVALAFVTFSVNLGGYYINYIAFCLCIGAIIHLACDLLTPMGLPILNPFKQGGLSLNFIRTGSLQEFLFTAIFTTGTAVWKLYQMGYIHKGLLNI